MALRPRLRKRLQYRGPCIRQCRPEIGEGWHYDDIGTARYTPSLLSSPIITAAAEWVQQAFASASRTRNAQPCESPGGVMNLTQSPRTGSAFATGPGPERQVDRTDMDCRVHPVRRACSATRVKNRSLGVTARASTVPVPDARRP